MSDNLTSKRGCIVIGINQYNKPKIPDLKGAENDANEIAKILQQYGKFASNKDCHILLGPNATSENIRTAINDLFWSEDRCDIILFYFSGHGMWTVTEMGT